MKNSTEGLENKDEEISQKVEQEEKYGKYERKDTIRESVQKVQHSERENWENREEIINKIKSRKVPRTTLVRWKELTNHSKQWIRKHLMKDISGTFINNGDRRLNRMLGRNNQATCKGSGIRMALDFSTTTLEPKGQWSKIFQIMKENYLEPRIPYKE